MINIAKLVCTVDFSSTSRLAFDYAIVVAQKFSAELILLHVFEDVPLLTAYAGHAEVGELRYAEDSARKELAAWIAGAGGDGLRIRVEISRGTTEDVIVDFCEREKPDLLVMGTHGRSGLGRLVMGSVAEGVFRQAACPVLTIGPKVSAQAPQEAEFKEIIFATDFSPESLAAPYALSLAQEFQARLTLVHVAPQVAELETDSERILQELDSLIPVDAKMWCRPECMVKFGVPAAGILEVAAEKHADLIVLGVRSAAGHVGAATHAAAATAHSVVCGAACPVLTVRERRT
jgi:nucleotide-binding universal stress UspA family protein